MSKAKNVPSKNTDDLEEKKKVVDELHRIVGKISGGKTKEFGEMIIQQLDHACYSQKEVGDILLNIIANMGGINPQDQIEGMLGVQMLATHHATMKCFARAASLASHSQAYEASLHAAAKLTRCYTLQMEALNRHRGKGQQKMTVEHVHVHSGGQAIVGSISSTKND